jgi:MFS transporter, AAHS family, 4-hydroxybenzoate transporter
MNVLDGIDVMTISYAAPMITKEWTIAPQALGGVFSTALFGMGVGALFLAPLADVVGRRKAILAATTLMGIMVFCTSWANDIWQLSIYHFLSGLSVGTILACTAALSAEYAPSKMKNFWISFVMGGYAIGAAIAGLSAVFVMLQGWRFNMQVLPRYWSYLYYIFSS